MTLKLCPQYQSEDSSVSRFSKSVIVVVSLALLILALIACNQSRIQLIQQQVSLELMSNSTGMTRGRPNDIGAGGLKMIRQKISLAWILGS